MNVASKELSDELFKLSDWRTNKFVTLVNEGMPSQYIESVEPDDGEVMEDYRSAYPAYDAGFLLRKLPDEAGAQNAYVEKGVFIQKQSTLNTTFKYRAAYRYGKIRSQYADTPENALAKLAIELFKQGILKKGQE